MSQERCQEMHNYSAGLSLDGPAQALIASVSLFSTGLRAMSFQGSCHNLLYRMRWVSGLAALVLLVACAGAPVQEMSDARQAVAAAEQTLAGKPASPVLQSAKQFLQAAQAALDSGDFSTAREDAQRARQLALHAMDGGQPGDGSGHGRQRR